MYQYNVSNDVTDKAVSVISAKDDKKKELEDKIKSIQDRFDLSSDATGGNLPDSNLDLEELEFKDKTDDEIKSEAESSLGQYYRSGIADIEQDIKDEADNYNAKANQLISSNEESKKNIDQYTESAKQSLSDEALKRGLARSSIVINKMEAFDRDKLDKYAELDKQLTGEMDAINFELNALEGKRKQALSDFELEYADKLNQKISSLKSELDKRRDEVTKYNNEIREKEKEYEADVAKLARQFAEADDKKTQELLEYATKNGYTNLELFKREAVYFAVDNYLKGLDPETIDYVLNSKKVQDSLPESYISTLRAKYLD